MHGFFDIVTLFLVLEVILFDIIKLKCKKFDYIFVFNLTFLFLLFLAMFRYGVGSDTPNYMVAYNYVPPLDKLKLSDFSLFRFSPLYLFINSLCRSIYDDYLTLQILQCTFFFGGIYYVLKILAIRKLYILLYFYLFLYFFEGMSAMRECFAISCCFIAFLFYHKKHFFLYCIAVFIGFNFHSGAIFFYILPVVRLFANKGNKGFYSLILLFILFSIIIFPYFESYQLLFAYGDGSISRYLNTETTGISYSNVLRNMFLILVIKKYVYDSARIREKEYPLLAVCFCTLDIVAGAFPIVFRIAGYLYVFMYYSLYQFLCNVRKKQLVLNLFVLFLFFYQPVQRYLYIDGIDPYCSVFSSDKSYYIKVIKSESANDYIIY